MKKLLLVLLVIIGMTSCVSMQSLSTLKQNNIVKINISTNLTKEQSYDKIKFWLIENITDSKSAIEYEDKQSGIIAGKYDYDYPYLLASAGYTNSFKIITKDNSVSITIKLNKAYGKNSYGAKQYSTYCHKQHELEKSMNLIINGIKESVTIE